MKIRDCMSADVQICDPQETICDAAKMMADRDTGFLPVGENDRLVGMITDRDIAIRAVAQNRGPDTPIREVMSAEVLYCFEDDDADDVLANMGENQIRRLPVLSREKRLVGVISLSDLSHERGEDRQSGRALGEITRHGGQHSQARH